MVSDCRDYKGLVSVIGAVCTLTYFRVVNEFVWCSIGSFETIVDGDECFPVF